jgi:carboxyl-terminal processing protease
MTNHLLTALALLLFSSQAVAQDAAQPAGQSAVTIAGGATPEILRRDTFDMVWRTVDENHFDPTFGGLDWTQIRRRYEPLALSAKTDAEFHDVLRRMVGELKLSHFVIYPPGALDSPPTDEAKSEAAALKRGTAGLDLRFIGGQAVITRVEPGSGGESAGLRMGFVIRGIDGRDLTRPARRSAAGESSESYRQTRLRAALLSALDGAVGETRRLTFLDGRGRVRSATLTLLASTAEMSEPFGNFPAMPTQFETRRFGQVGYVRFNIWVASLMPKLRGAMKELRDSHALVFDLRGNPGGLGVMGMGLAGLLSDRELSLGTMRQRRGHTNFLVNPQPNPFLGPVVVLMDNLSGSTSELFALGLQEVGRITVVGERSAGAALPSMFVKLPTGATFQFAFADFKTPKGVPVEGRGVMPDVEVRLDRRSLLAGRDPQLEAALEIARRAASTQSTGPIRK